MDIAFSLQQIFRYNGVLISWIHYSPIKKGLYNCTTPLFFSDHFIALEPFPFQSVATMFAQVLHLDF
jgi:hypothetical protein